MARNRVIYQSEGLYVSENASTLTATGHEQLNRVQSANYSFTINRQDVNQFGDLARIDSLVLEPPTVSLDFSYYLTDGFNERSLGFFVETTGVGMNRGSAGTANSKGNLASGHLISSSGVNFYIATSPDGIDLNQTGTGVPLDSNDRVIGVGNCYVSDYSVELAVGSLPTVNVTVEGANMNAAPVSSTGTIPSPAVDQTAGTIFEHQAKLPNPTADGGITGTLGEAPITALRPGDVSLTLSGVNGMSLIKLTGDDGAHVQSASISLPLSRSPIDRLGSRFPFAREVDFPVTATMNISAIVADSQAGNLANLLNSGVQEASILVKDKEGVNAIQYRMKGLKVDSQSFSSSIGSNKTVDITFSTQIGGPNDVANGVFMSGINGTNKVFT
tara:strand:+ start:486 stop:1646 length:1161 start_codon:yes stop_codon:yes gene_type:complete